MSHSILYIQIALHNNTKTFDCYSTIISSECLALDLILLYTYKYIQFNLTPMYHLYTIYINQ